MSLATVLSSFATRVGNEIKAHRVLINNNAADLSALTTTAKSNLVAALNEVNAKPSGAVINDTTPSTTTAYSSTKTNSAIAAAVATVVNSSPAALDTLGELASALGGDAAFSTTVATSLGNRVRFDAAQSLTTPQQTQALSNIGAASAVGVGDTAVDLVTAFNAALV